jgi:hypothetical protein
MVSYSVHVWKGLIVAGGTRQQQHLLGAYSFASSGLIDLNQRGLSQSGTWNYLREEITMALELRRPVRIGTGFESVPNENISHDMWSDYISYILAKVINFSFNCAGGTNLEQRSSVWQDLDEEISVWRSNRPRSFDSLSTASRSENASVSLWLLSPWHGTLNIIKFGVSMLIMIVGAVAGEQHLSVAAILLELSKPQQDTYQFGIHSSEENRELWKATD